MGGWNQCLRMSFHGAHKFFSAHKISGPDLKIYAECEVYFWEFVGFITARQLNLLELDTFYA